MTDDELEQAIKAELASAVARAHGTAVVDIGALTATTENILAAVAEWAYGIDPSKEAGPCGRHRAIPGHRAPAARPPDGSIDRRQARRQGELYPVPPLRPADALRPGKR